MEFQARSIGALPTAESVENGDLIPVYRNNTAYAAVASTFKGADATINGVNALTIQAGDGISLDQSGATLYIGAAENGLLMELIQGIDAPIYRTATGAPLTIADGYGDTDAQVLTVTFPVTQTGAGTPSPENVRPFTGFTGVELTHSNGQTAYAQIDVAFKDGETPITIYAGTMDILSGGLTVTHGHIAAYAGETIPGAWYSSVDDPAQVQGPSTGAEVVYELDTPLTYALTSSTVQIRKGVNTLTPDAGTVTLKYRSDVSLL